MTTERVRYASKLRCKQRDGKEWTAEERAWMEQYEETGPRVGRKSKPPPSPVDSEPSDDSPNNAREAPQESSGGAPKQPPPIDMGEDNAASSSTTEAEPGGADRGSTGNPSATGATGERKGGGGTAPSAPPGGGGGDFPPPTPEQLEQYKSGALALCGWMNNIHRQMEERGLPAIPEKAIAMIVFPNVLMTAIMCHKYLQRMSKIGAPVVTGGSLAMTMAGMARLRKMDKESSGSARAKPAPPNVVEAREAPQPPPGPKSKVEADIDLRIV